MVCSHSRAGVAPGAAAQSRGDGVPMFTIPKILEMESPSAGTLVHIFASVRGESRSSGRKRPRNDVEPHRLRRTQEGDQLLKGILALLPASPQNAHQNLLGSCAVPGPVA